MKDPFVQNDINISKLFDVIDAKFEICKNKNLSRFSVEWGKWSREMNIAIREMIENDHPKKVQLQDVFAYWTTSSQLLELYYTKPFLCSLEIRRLENEKKRLRKNTLSMDLPEFSMRNRLATQI